MAGNAEFWQGRRVAITGATGFIGHHLAMRLVRSGAVISALVRAGSAITRLREAGIRCAIAPLDQPEAIAEAAMGCDLFFHLAGAVDFGTDPQRCHEVNVVGTSNALNSARQAGVRRFIHASSIVAVGANRRPEPIDETATWNLDHCGVPYATTKRAAEELVLAHSGSPEVVVVNPACVVGPDDFSSSEFGTICKRFWRGRLPFHSGRGNNFVDVRDVAAGMMLAAELGRAGERYILGGENQSYSEFFRLLARVDGRWHLRMRVPLFVANLSARIAARFPRRKSRPYLTLPQVRMMSRWCFFDSSKAQRELGYSPRSLEQSLRDAYHFWMPKKAA